MSEGHRPTESTEQRKPPQGGSGTAPAERICPKCAKPIVGSPVGFFSWCKACFDAGRPSQGAPPKSGVQPFSKDEPPTPDTRPPKASSLERRLAALEDKLSKLGTSSIDLNSPNGKNRITIQAMDSGCLLTMRNSEQQNAIEIAAAFGQVSVGIYGKRDYGKGSMTVALCVSPEGDPFLQVTKGERVEIVDLTDSKRSKDRLAKWLEGFAPQTSTPPPPVFERYEVAKQAGGEFVEITSDKPLSPKEVEALAQSLAKGPESSVGMSVGATSDPAPAGSQGVLRPPTKHPAGTLSRRISDHLGCQVVPKDMTHLQLSVVSNVFFANGCLHYELDLGDGRRMVRKASDCYERILREIPAIQEGPETFTPSIQEREQVPCDKSEASGTPAASTPGPQTPSS